ncbi:MAG: sialate O-acetylesterase [Planctomycetaceae bacterium]|nr:sialate O-acetylesterase [Planctomycetaceae bacterium]
MMRGFCWSLLALTVIANPLLAEVKTPAVFGSHMVLQRDIAIPVWGWADPGEKVTVSFRDQTASATAGDDGKWKVSLDAESVGDPATLTVAGKSNTLTFEDVLLGEVWVCSGQSNMQWSVQAGLDPDLEIAAANHPNIRLFQVPLVAATEPQDDVNAEWKHCTPENIPGFTAVGYNFGRKLQRVLGVPVGLIQTAWGGTRAEAWTSPEAMAETEELKPILDSWADQRANYDADKAQAAYEAAMERWEAAAKKAREDGKNPPRRPQLQGDPARSQHHPSTLYNAMVHPLAPYAIRGAIWYQGESNASRAYQYRKLMPTMIQSWRDTWGQGDFHFYQVQLANFKAKTDQPGESDWAELREAQHMAKDALPNVDSACIIDIGAARDIHPKDKQNVGRRLARLALYDVYGMKNIVRQGPTFESMSVDGNKALLKFDNHGAPLTSYYNEPLQGFAVAGEDKQWVWGNARIVDGATVEVTHPGGTTPVAVRYNWADNPSGNLYNGTYLPAYPFRTDDWKGVTADNVRP